MVACGRYLASGDSSVLSLRVRPLGSMINVLGQVTEDHRIKGVRYSNDVGYRRHLTTSMATEIG